MHHFINTYSVINLSVNKGVECERVTKQVLIKVFISQLCLITLTPYMVLLLFATRFADYAGGIWVPFIQPRLF